MEDIPRQGMKVGHHHLDGSEQGEQGEVVDCGGSCGAAECDIGVMQMAHGLPTQKKMNRE